MATFKCKMCGGTLEIESGSTVAECEYCGAKQTLPRLDDEKRSNLLERANQLRRNNDFDKAASIYEQILSEDNSDSEIYWSIVLCQYGIEYVEDPLSKKRVPTVNRTQYTSIFDNENYKEAILKADSYQRLIYEEEAKQINKIQKEILEISQKEEPFDVFICYKETDANGQRTIDSVLANDLYYQLKQENFKVFYAKITLEDKLGSAYEPYIFAALNSSKVMVVVGTKPEYFEAPWVKNEWSRFLAQIKKGEKKMLIPAYRDMDPYNLPIEFSHLQAQDMSKLGFMQDLIRGIKKILGKDNKKVEVVEKVIQNTDSAAPLLRRAHLFLEDKDFVSADEYAEKVLDINPECSQAYLIKLLVEYKLSSVKDLEKSSNENIFNSANYNKAYRFANEKEKENLDKISKQVYNNSAELKKAKIYVTANELLVMEDFASAIEEFNKIIDYKDSKEKIELAKEKSETNRKQKIYNTAIGHINMSRFEDAKKLFKSIEDFKDSKEKIEYCDSQIEMLKKDDKYYKAIGIINNYQSSISKLKNALELLNSIIGYKDVDSRIRSLNAKIEDLEAKQKIKEQQEKERLEAERRTKERNEQIKKQIKERLKRNAKKIIGIASAAVVFFTTLVFLIISLIIPTIKFNKATDFLNQGMYNEALKLYGQIGDFKEANSYYNVADAVKSFDNKRLYSGLESLYEAKVPVKINYNMNDGYFSNENLSDSNIKGKKRLQGNSDVVSFEYNAGEDFRELKIPSRIGYTFYDWSFIKYSYQVGGQFLLDIEAVWNETQYSVSYELNGGLFWNQSPINNYYVTTNTFTLYEPVKKGYDFVGWIGTDLTSPAKTVTISQGSIGNRNYEAVWEAKDYVITYDPNGGSVSSTTQTVTFNEQYYLLTPTRLGYVFLGWYDANNRQFYSGIYNVDYNVELTAKWELGSYKLTLDDTRKSNESVTVYFMNNYNGGIHETVTLKNNQVLNYPANPERSGYVFNGWHIDSSANNDYNFTGSITSDLYLYAGWTPSNYNVLTSDTMSVTLNGTSNIYYGFIPLVSETITVYSTGDYDTRGYLYSSTLSQLKYDDDSGNGSNFSYTYNVTAGNLYYIAINSYSSSTYGSVTLNVTRTNTIYSSAYASIEENIFSYDTSSNYVSTLLHNTSFTLPELELTGYTFDGWYDEDDNKVISGVFAFGKDVTLTPKFTPNEYTITYEANEGTTSSTTQNVIFDEPYTLLEPTRTGYTFLGWYDEDDNKVESGTWTFDRDVTLKAIWTLKEFVITYNPNGGELSTLTQAVKYDDYYYLASPTRTGYLFKGWYTEEDVKFNNGTWKLSENINLKAKWEIIDYTITLNPNGGSISNTSIVVNYNDDVKLETPERIGYTFIGWYIDESLVELDKFTYTSNITLTAKWDANTYELTYNETEFIEAEFPSYTVYFMDYDDTTVYKKVTLGYEEVLTYPTNPTRIGYVFAGWYKDKSKTTQFNFTDNITGDLYLYSRWQAYSSKYTDTIDNNEFISSSSEPVDYYYAFVPLKDQSVIFKYYDYINTYISWQILDSNYNALQLTTHVNGNTGSASIGYSCKAGNLYYLNVSHKTTRKEDVTIETNIILSLESTSVCKCDKDTILYNKESNHTVEVNYDAKYELIEPTRAGYTFMGWYTEEDVKFESGTWNLTSDVTLTSKWEMNKRYILTYNPNGGEIDELSQKYYFGEEYQLLEPTRVGYEFDGWYNGSTKVSSGIWEYLSDVTLEAKWNLINYTITYNLDGGKNNVYNPSKYNYEYEDIVINNPTKKGYTFIGWTSDGVYVPIKDYLIKHNSIGNIELTANFQANTYYVTYNINGGNEIDEYIKEIQYGSHYELIEPTRAGYEFDGWYYEQGKLSNGIWTLENDITLVAKWKIITYDIIYDLKGGYNYDNPHTYTYEDDTIVLQDPLKEGHTFIGWINDSVFVPTKWLEIVHNSQGDLYFEAVFEPNEYTISLDANGGELIGNTEIIVLYGEMLNLPTPKKDGLVFVGWSNGEEIIESGIMSKAEDQTLVAKYLNLVVENGVTYVSLGKYPQTKVKDQSIISNLSTIVDTNEFGYIVYSDNEYYKYNSDYYLVEDVRWRVLSNQNGNYTLISEKIISARAFGNHDFANSAIKTWLNEEFYNQIFSSLDKEIVKDTIVDGRVPSGGNEQYDSCIVKVFLPTRSDLNEKIYKSYATNFSEALINDSPYNGWYLLNNPIIGTYGSKGIMVNKSKYDFYSELQTMSYMTNVVFGVRPMINISIL